MRRALVITLALTAVAAVLIPSPAARPDASRIVDRTFNCTAGYLGGVYQVDIDSYWYVDPQTQRRTPSATVSTSLTNGFLGGISSSSLYVNRLHCRATNAKVALTTKGLSGGALDALGAQNQCFTSRRILVRIRGEFRKPTQLRVASPSGYPQFQALGPTTQTELAIATIAGRPIAYAATAGPRKARLFTSTDCRED